MARIRTIKPEFPQSETIGRLSRDARLLFIQLWTLADDSGRARGASRILASLLYPFDEDSFGLIDGWLAELEREQLIARYQAEGSTYLQIVNWLKHQKIDKPSPSRLPEFDEASRILATDLGPRTLDHGPRTEEEELAQTAPAVIAPASPVVLSPAVGSIPLVDGTQWHFTEEDVGGWREAFPAVDVLQQLRAYREWAKSTPTKRKTRKGIRKSVTQWLSSKQDKAGGPAHVRTDAVLERQRLNLEGIAEAARRLDHADGAGGGFLPEPDHPKGDFRGLLGCVASDR